MAAALPESLGAATGDLPKGVAGKMDGEKPPMSNVEEIQKAWEPYKQKYGSYLQKLRPWREFLRLSKPEGDIKRRLEVNLTHYQINYAVIFLLQMIVAIVMNPKCLIVICILTLVWMAFLKKNDDPTWEVNVGGVELGKTQRWMALSAITSIVLLCVVGQVLFSAAFFSAVCVVLHGILHPVPDGEYGLQVDEMI
uniref:PRA1 family protein n=1 Tax=Strombidinopsis acuminata TaxID=141414 RepID=A0A7S3WAL0_9SPIT